MRMADDDEADDELAVDGPKKSERKRQRERQRRSDLANAFDELSSLLSQIDPDDSDSALNKRRRRRSVTDASDGDVDGSGMTRLDLIGRTAEVLIKLQRENAELRQRLNEQCRPRDDDKEVLVMVPTLSPADPDASSAVASRTPSSYPSYHEFPQAAHAPPSTDYSQQPSFSYDYYRGRPSSNRSHHSAYATYPGQQQHANWLGHQPPLHPTPPATVPRSEQLNHGQYPQGHHTMGVHPPTMLPSHQMSYPSQPKSPQRGHPHPYDSNRDPNA